jgi:hypothetical protein
MRTVVLIGLPDSSSEISMSLQRLIDKGECYQWWYSLDCRYFQWNKYSSSWLCSQDSNLQSPVIGVNDKDTQLCQSSVLRALGLYS